METVYWTMKNGQEIDIDKMDLQHLQNTLKMIVKQSKKPLVRQEFSFNGDMAEHFNDMSREYDDECRSNQWN